MWSPKLEISCFYHLSVSWLPVVVPASCSSQLKSCYLLPLQLSPFIIHAPPPESGIKLCRSIAFFWVPTANFKFSHSESFGNVHFVVTGRTSPRGRETGRLCSAGIDTEVLFFCSPLHFPLCIMYSEYLCTYNRAPRINQVRVRAPASKEKKIIQVWGRNREYERSPLNQTAQQRAEGKPNQNTRGQHKWNTKLKSRPKVFNNCDKHSFSHFNSKE